MIYLDNAATTPVKERTLEKMLPYYTKEFGNPGGVSELSANAKRAMECGRKHISDLIGAAPEEIFFTSGGTESDNWALICGERLRRDKGRHIITTKIEHHAIINTCEYLKKTGCRITYLDVDKYGMINLSQLKKEICEDTVLISIMYGNNEIGTIQAVEDIGRFARSRGILFHTDAVQAVGHVPIDVSAQYIDMMSASGHKFGGPKGIGFLYVKEGIDLPPLIHGGSQERGKRGGTGNVPAVAGMGEAARISMEQMEGNIRYITGIREYMINRVLKEIPYARLNGHRHNRLPGNISLSFRFVEGQAVAAMLAMKNIAVSTASACQTGDEKPSHVLKAIGLSDELAYGTIRITISESITKRQADMAVNEIKNCVAKQREMSTEYKQLADVYKNRSRYW